jgi:hypothetical protein
MAESTIAHELAPPINYANLLFNRARMKANPTLHRIKFSDVPVGQRFYDPISAEYFVKQNANLAAMVTGAGDGSVADEFEVDDIVGIEQS